MAFPYDTPFGNNNKVDLDTFPEVAAVNKMLAPEVNALTDGVNALADAVTAGVFHGLEGDHSPAVAPLGGVRLKAGAAGLEVSFSGGAYAPLSGGGGTWGSITGTLANQTDLQSALNALALALGSFGTTPDAKGATVAGQTITLQPADGTHPGAVSLADQVMGAGNKTFSAAVGMVSAPTAPVSGAGEIRFRSNAGSPEVSANGGAYTTVATGTGTLDTPQPATSSGGHIALSLAAHCNYYHTTTENTVLDAPTNALAGMAGCIEIDQGAAARTLTFATFWKFSGGITPPVTPTIGAKDKLFFYVGHDNTYATCRLVGNVS